MCSLTQYFSVKYMRKKNKHKISDLISISESINNKYKYILEI